MRDKQNPAAVNDGASATEDGQSPREKSEEEARSYYYDDATGYEIYENEDDTESDEQVTDAEEEA